MTQQICPSIFAEASMAATVLRVRNVEKSVDWYRDKLGLEPLHVGHDGPDHPIASFMIAGGVVALWQLAPDESPVVDDQETGTYVVAVMNASPEQLRHDLVERGVEVGPVRRSENNEYVWFYDPDGNRFELSRPITA